MDKVLSEFINEMEFIKQYIKLQKESHTLYFQSSASNSMPIAKIKQFDFSSYIISIYGAYEHFLEQMMSQYLKKVCGIVSKFSQLPKDIQHNNLSKTLDIIKKLEYPKYKHLKEHTLIEILHKNMNEDSPYLNIDAFKTHTANFKIGVINSYFSNIGIHNFMDIIKEYPPLNEELSQEYTDYQKVKNSIVFSKIEEICDIRNNIAHGSKSVQLLGDVVLYEYIDFFISFAKSLSNVLKDHFNEFLFIQSNVLNSINVFQKSIIGFNTQGMAFNKQNKIVVKMNNLYPKYVTLNILEIQQNKISLENVTSTDPIEIAIKVDQEISGNVHFIIING